MTARYLNSSITSLRLAWDSFEAAPQEREREYVEAEPTATPMHVH
jgi:hypothetical protein